ncbi:MAG: DEAD/DEAH box helicase, partial [Firmicutes bacterium]|nr:DEAD/DEAH box helicase [Bacillota bacterium]
MPVLKFREFGLSNDLQKSLNLLRFDKPTRVQEEVIPALLKKKDLIVNSQTGSGKTAAYAIPLCQLIDWEENKPQALIIVPTRELALQVKEDIFNIGRFKRIKVAALYGKQAFKIQERQIKQKTHIVVGTPGRILDHLERGTFDASKIGYLVLDEADEMLKIGFIDQIEMIISQIPKKRVTVLLSATIPEDIEALCNKHMINPKRIVIEENNSPIKRIVQERYAAESTQKIKLLRDLLVIENPDSCIIFCNTQQKVNDIYNELTRLETPCAKIHGGMEQENRLKIMDDFKSGHFRYLVATDVAARGIDIDNISLIINFEVPEEKETYVHRIGRTGRQNKEGKAISLMAPYEKHLIDNIQTYTRTKIILKQKPDRKTVEANTDSFLQKLKTKPDLKEDKGAELNKDILRLHINAGRKTRMRASDIVGTLCNIDGITKDDIGIINIVDVSTFVEILNGKGEYVYRS